MHPPVEGIVLNVKGRQSNGIVTRGSEYDSLRNEIISQTADVVDPESGVKVVKSAYLREQLYHGPMLQNAPDVILELDSDFVGGTGLEQVVESVDIAIISQLSGIHAMDGIIVVSGSGVIQGESFQQASIVDLAPTILHLLGLPVLEDFEGKVLVNSTDGTQSKRALKSFEFVPDDTQMSTEGFTSEQEAEIFERLRQLGYVE
jgi:predicted AlkP superfamily phosphohydrolase/phosphomutase